MISLSRRLSLTNLVFLYNPDIVCVTETWFDSCFDESVIASSSYKLVSRRDRSCGSHGGVAILCRTHIAVTKVKCKSDFVAAAIFHAVPDTMVICIYNPPSNSPYRRSSAEIISVLEQVICPSLCERVLILGDFNQPDVNWHTYTTNDADFMNLLDFLVDNHFEQLVKHSTHRSGNILDLVFRNFNDVVVNPDFIPTFSDHNAIVMSFQSKLLMSASRSISSVSSSALPYLCAFLEESLFSVLHDCRDNDYVRFWFENLSCILSMFSEQKRQKRLLYPWYYSSHSIHVINKRNTFCRRHRKAGIPCNHVSLDKDCEDSIALDTQIYMDSFKRTGNLAGCYKLINAISKSSNSPSHIHT